MEAALEPQAPHNRKTSDEDAAERSVPLVRFFRLIPEGRAPQRADRAAAGTLPTRAFRFCEAVTTASAFGWYVFPPIGFSLHWEGGSDLLWTHDGAESWHPLKTAQFPGFADHFDRVVPPDVKGFSPPFLGAFTEPGLVQVWSGLVARTAPGWHLLVRAPANLPRSQGYEVYEGIVETDRWFGPLFTNIRLTRTHAPVEFSAELPFLQVQPIQSSLCGDILNRFDVTADLEGFEPSDWDAYRRTVVTPSMDRERQRGEYSAAVRRRRKRAVGAECPARNR
jgi:hypothetical protein